MAAEQLTRLPTDLLVEILRRGTDGPSLASAACACTCLRGAAKEEALWAELCHGAWPSTTESTARKLVSSMPGGFAKFYADSLPLLLYKSHRRRGSVHLRDGAGMCSRSLDLISFVDVYYKKKCVLSRVVHGIPVHDPATTGSPDRCPFKLDAFDAVAVNLGGGETEASTPSMSLELKEEGGVGVLNWALEEDLTLSWGLLDVGRGRAVNISGGRPAAVQRDFPSKGDVVVCFGCAVPVEKQLLACGVAECVVSMRCRLSEEEAEDRVTCTGIELQVKDAEGLLVDRRRSLAVLERALCYEERTRKEGVAAGGYRAYLKDCRETREKGTVSGVLVEKLCAVSGVVMFLVAFCFLYVAMIPQAVDFGLHPVFNWAPK